MPVRLNSASATCSESFGLCTLDNLSRVPHQKKDGVMCTTQRLNIVHYRIRHIADTAALLRLPYVKRINRHIPHRILTQIRGLTLYKQALIAYFLAHRFQEFSANPSFQRHVLEILTGVPEHSETKQYALSYTRDPSQRGRYAADLYQQLAWATIAGQSQSSNSFFRLSANDSYKLREMTRFERIKLAQIVAYHDSSPEDVWMYFPSTHHQQEATLTIVDHHSYKRLSCL